MEYNKVLNFVEEEFYNGEGNAWHCHRILGHKRVDEDDPEYDNCPYNILVEWTDGQRSWEPANIFRGDTLEWMVGKYAYDNDLLRDKYWKRYKGHAKNEKMKGHAKNEKKMQRLVHQYQLFSYRTQLKYMFGVRVPKNQ